MSKDYFCYFETNGMETYNTPEEAMQSAENAIDYCRDCADDEWGEMVDEGVDSICWGKITQRASVGMYNHSLIDTNTSPETNTRIIRDNNRLSNAIRELVHSGMVFQSLHCGEYETVNDEDIAIIESNFNGDILRCKKILSELGGKGKYRGKDENNS